MTVLNQVKTNVKTVLPKDRDYAASCSSRAAARARLESLGLGNTIAREAPRPRQLSKAKAASVAKPTRWSEYRGVCDIQLEKSTEPYVRDNKRAFGRIDKQRAKPAKSEERLKSAEYISHFHAYAISLFSVLALSTWIFGYFILH